MISRTNNTIIDANTTNPIHDDGILIPSTPGGCSLVRFALSAGALRHTIVRVSVEHWRADRGNIAKLPHLLRKP
jgi:hypothetical protein